MMNFLKRLLSFRVTVPTYRKSDVDHIAQKRAMVDQMRKEMGLPPVRWGSPNG